MLFYKSSKKHCCLCLETENLTGEHKIKQSALSTEFGKQKLYIGDFSSDSKLKLAQSTKSKYLKFKTRLCAKCNNQLTQPSDRAFDFLHEYMLKEINKNKISKVENLLDVFENKESLINVFRYFAKILCCQIAESEGPVPVRLANFAIFKEEDLSFLGEDFMFNVNIISDKLKYNTKQFASHGGLLIYFNKYTKMITAMHSELTINNIQYVFWFRLNKDEVNEMNSKHLSFKKKSMAAIDKTITNQISNFELLKLGIIK